MTTLLLLACVTTAPTHAAADEAQAESVRAIDLTEQEGTYSAAMQSPAPVIAACANSGGSLTYGPSDDVAVMWVDGVIYVDPAPGLANCIAWTWR